MKKRILAVFLCIAMMAIGGFATWAYLTSNESVTNTFTVGNVQITLDERDVDVNGIPVPDADPERVATNEYHLIPGHEYMKDPIVHVDSESENCYVYVTVKNDIANIEAPNGEEDYVTIIDQMAENGWTELTGVTKDGLQVYYYNLGGNSIVANSANLTVFEEFRIAGSVINTVLAGYETNGEANIIKVTAYAIQADGFDTAAEAWAAANSQF